MHRLLCFGLLCSACNFGEPGLRARGVICLEPGECAPETPNGLVFSGATLGDESLLGGPLHPTATGGVQRIGFDDPFAMPVEHGPVALRSEIESVMAVERAPSFGWRVRGVSEGTARLRVENEEGLLYDAIDLQVRDIAYIAMVGVDAYGTTHGPNDAFAVFAGAKVDVAFAIHASDGTRLVDEGLMGYSPYVLAGVTPFWDATTIRADDSAAVAVDVFTSAGVRYTPTLPIVRTIDRIARVEANGGSLRPISFAPGSDVEACYLALSTERIVLGAPLVFEASGVATTFEPRTHLTETRCVGLSAAEAGAAELRISAPGAERVDRVIVQ